MATKQYLGIKGLIIGFGCSILAKLSTGAFIITAMTIFSILGWLMFIYAEESSNTDYIVKSVKNFLKKKDCRF